MHLERMGLPRLIAFNESSTTRHLKKEKEVVGKTRATTWQGSVEGGAQAHHVESDARLGCGEKEGGGL
jgi:hypothetical protein